MPEWLPQSYKAPDLPKAPEVLASKTLTMKDIENVPRASKLTGLGNPQFFIDEPTLCTALKETSVCQKYFQAAGQKGYSRYSTTGVVDHGEFKGVLVTLSNK